MHICGHTYTEAENRKMMKECRFCADGYYKELAENEKNSEKCSKCDSCGRFKVSRHCSKRYGTICSRNECIDDYFLTALYTCEKCCICTANAIKEDGCKGSKSKKVCGIIGTLISYVYCVFYDCSSLVGATSSMPCFTCRAHGAR